MAVSVPTAFEDGGLWLALGYVTVRGIGVWLHIKGTTDQAILASVKFFALASWPGPLAIVIGAHFEPPERSWIWLLGFLLEFAAAGLAGSATTRGIHSPSAGAIDRPGDARSGRRGQTGRRTTLDRTDQRGRRRGAASAAPPTNELPIEQLDRGLGPVVEPRGKAGNGSISPPFLGIWLLAATPVMCST